MRRDARALGLMASPHGVEVPPTVGNGRRARAWFVWTSREARVVWRWVLLIGLIGSGIAGAVAQEELLKATAPNLLSPADGARFRGVPGVVTLTVGNARGRFVQVDLDHRFEVYDATNDMMRVVSVIVPTAGEETVYQLLGPLTERTSYRWRARAEFQGAFGPWSELWTFETGVELGRVGLRFADVTIASGVAGETPARLGGHGVSFADATGDGRPDLYITMHLRDPLADQFFVNLGNGRFVEAGAGRGIADFDVGSHGAAWGDLDNDGDFDLVNGTTGEGAPNNVYRNDGGGTFTDVTPASMRQRRAGTRGVTLFDMDRDGDLDIFSVTGWRGSGDPPGERNELYRNEGKMRFAPVEGGAAVRAAAGQGVTDTDFDGDGDVDLVAGNRDGDVVMLRNDGTGNFALVRPRTIGIWHRAYSGVTTADIDDDGDLDMLLVGRDSARETIGHLYLNEGAGSFRHLRDFVDIDGFMGAFADLDHDGDVDLVFAGDDLVYLNDGGGVFASGPAVPVGRIRDPRAIAFADIDSDGDPDFAVGAKDSRNWLIRNEGRKGNWMKIRLRSPSGEAGAFGAKVAVYPAGRAGASPIAIRESRSANGYLGQNDPVLHVGLGDESVVDVIVRFLDGSIRMLSGVTSNRTVEIDGTIGGGMPIFVERYR